MSWGKLTMLAGLVGAAVGAAVPVPSQPNVLYLMSDDMRPQLGCYGQKEMSTPHLDSIAETGTLFNFAYTQFAYCAPSRNSFLSGRRPERTKCLNFLTDFRKEHGNAWVAMPELFKNHGYFTTSAGKIFHDGMDDPLSWSYKSNQTAWIGCQKGDMTDTNGNYCGVGKDSAKPYTDEDLALAEGLKRLDLAAQSGKPWFVAIGTHRPHHPSRLPAEWYGPEVYPGTIAPPKHPGAITNAPWMSGNWYQGDYKDPAHGCPTCIVPANRSVEYRRWYYAATSYADFMLGKALQKLKDIGAADTTITVFHADHGYQLGELNEWSKKTDTELATRVPLLMRVPWKPARIGKSTSVRAELIDIYRTLAELANLTSYVQDDVQGTSLAAVFDTATDADLPAAIQQKHAFSQIGSCACKTYTRGNWTGKECDAGRCFRTPVGDFDYMGYSVRTGTERYTVWVPMSNATKRVDWTQPVHHELYELEKDMGVDFDFDAYSVNVADEPQHAQRIQELYTIVKDAVLSWY